MRSAVARPDHAQLSGVAPILKRLIPPVMAVACLASINAHAVGPGDLGDVKNRTVSIGNSFSSGTGLFEDIYIFDTIAPEVAVGAAITVDLDWRSCLAPSFS